MELNWMKFNNKKIKILNNIKIQYLQNIMKKKRKLIKILKINLNNK